MKFTNEEKDLLLVKHNFVKIVGYAMSYEPPEADRVIISIEEIQKCIGKQAEVYYFEDKSDMEYARDLEDAWECLYDSVYEIIDAKTDENVDAFLKAELDNIKSKLGKK